jgi:hypothetical protein
MGKVGSLQVVRTFWAAVMAKKADHHGLITLELRVIAPLPAVVVISTCINLIAIAIPVR